MPGGLRMDSVCRAIFRAIHQGRWVSVEYRNVAGETTRYWMGVKALSPQDGLLTAEGLHLGRFTLRELCVQMDAIKSAEVVEGTTFPINEALVEDIRRNPQAYAALFGDTANLRILDYYVQCHRLDSTPYKTEYALVSRLDGDRLAHGACPLDAAQFRQLVWHFQRRSAAPTAQDKLRVKELALNELSIHAPQGLYVLAYRPLMLDVAARTLKAGPEAVVCKEFTINGAKQSIRQFLDPGDGYLLEDFAANRERIKDRITAYAAPRAGVDDMPYLIAIGRDRLLDLNREYAGALAMYQRPETLTAPIQAFFGGLTQRPRRRKSYPLALLNRQVNLDQLLAINNALRFPLAYIQGPPGTGKTTTIINTISTAFFNERTVLFASYNNHPIDGVFNAFQQLRYRGRRIPFPIVRLGNNERLEEAVAHMRGLYEQAKGISVYDGALEKDRQARVRRAGQLTALLGRYDEIRDLNERRETIERLLESRSQIHFQADLQARQLTQVKARLAQQGQVRAEDALALLDTDQDAFLKYLFYTAAKYIKRLDEPKNQDLLAILYAPKELRASQLNQFLAEDENLRRFLRVFPLVATTCISAHKLGSPRPAFDMVILDEASQCNAAVSLVPILRGENLMLVGDPQQLQPVILLDQADNLVLRRRFGIPREYDYTENSIYKTYLACDPVSDEVLLSHHYRCHPQIIGFNNRKYYNGKLQIESKAVGEAPLVFVDVPGGAGGEKNTAPQEAEAVVAYLKKHPGQRAGVITPFAKQRAYIAQRLKEEGMDPALCGTVHAFQGDEKDVILFSLALSGQTRPQTYSWLKNNKELINVATSRARERLVVLANQKELERLHAGQAEDDLYELVEYVRTKGRSQVTEKTAASRALGVKPYSTQMEEAFLANLNHALDNALADASRYAVHKEVPIAQVFTSNPSCAGLFYTGRFDFVVYERQGGEELPLLAIELDGKEHMEDAAVRARDRQKEAICREHGFSLIRVENAYARRYHYVKDILIRYFSGR